MAQDAPCEESTGVAKKKRFSTGPIARLLKRASHAGGRKEAPNPTMNRKRISARQKLHELEGPATQ